MSERSALVMVGFSRSFTSYSRWGVVGRVMPRRLLQIGSELGLSVVLLIALLMAWAYYLATPGSASAGLVALSAPSALLIHSFVDHTLEFPAITLAAGAVVGRAARDGEG